MVSRAGEMTFDLWQQYLVTNVKPADVRLACSETLMELLKHPPTHVRSAELTALTLHFSAAGMDELARYTLKTRDTTSRPKRNASGELIVAPSVTSSISSCRDDSNDSFGTTRSSSSASSSTVDLDGSSDADSLHSAKQARPSFHLNNNNNKSDSTALSLSRAFSNNNGGGNNTLKRAYTSRSHPIDVSSSSSSDSFECLSAPLRAQFMQLMATLAMPK